VADVESVSTIGTVNGGRYGCACLDPSRACSGPSKRCRENLVVALLSRKPGRLRDESRTLRPSLGCGIQTYLIGWVQAAVGELDLREIREPVRRTQEKEAIDR
jgi:hypothetical protein